MWKNLVDRLPTNEFLREEVISHTCLSQPFEQHTIWRVIRQVNMSTGWRTSVMSTGWRRFIGCLKLEVIFCKRATHYRFLLREMTHKDKSSYDSPPPCTCPVIQGRPIWVLYATTATYCNTLQHAVPHCTTLQQTMTTSFIWAKKKPKLSERIDLSCGGVTLQMQTSQVCRVAKYIHIYLYVYINIYIYM